MLRIRNNASGMRTVATRARCFLDAVKRWSQVKTPERKEGGVLLLYAKGSIEKTAMSLLFFISDRAVTTHWTFALGLASFISLGENASRLSALRLVIVIHIHSIVLSARFVTSKLYLEHQ